MGDIFRNTEFVDWLGEQRPFYGNFVGVESPPYRVRFNISQNNTLATVFKWIDPYPKIILTNEFTNTIREVQPSLIGPGSGLSCSGNTSVAGGPEFFGYFTGNTGQKIIAEIDLISLAASNYNFYIDVSQPRQIYKIEYTNFRAGFGPTTHRCTSTLYYTDSTTASTTSSIVLSNPQITPSHHGARRTVASPYAVTARRFLDVW